MSLLKYNNPQWSRNANCSLGDCSGRTITQNGAKGLGLLTNHAFSRSKNENLFHWGLEITGGATIVSILDERLVPLAKLAGSLVLLTYFLGRSSYS